MRAYLLSRAFLSRSLPVCRCVGKVFPCFYFILVCSQARKPGISQQTLVQQFNICHFRELMPHLRKEPNSQHNRVTRIEILPLPPSPSLLYFSSSLAHLHIRCRLSHHPFPYSSISWGCFTRVPAISLAWPEMSITGLWWSPCCIMHRSVPLGKKWPTAKERWMEGWIMDGEMEERTTNAIYVSPNWRVALAHTPDAQGRVTPRLSDFWG